MSINFRAKLSSSSPAEWTGEIIPIRLDFEPYEAEVSARGSYFHLLFGHHAYGSYVCIPNWDVGTELALLSDTFWNFEKLSSTQLKKVDGCSVVYALLELSNHVKM